MSDLRLEGLSQIMEPLQAPQRSQRQAEKKSSEVSEKDSFSDLLNRSIGKVNELQVEADGAIKELIAGRSKNIHETMLAIEKADVAMKLMLQVRNKVIDAYREIMRMQV